MNNISVLGEESDNDPNYKTPYLSASPTGTLPRRASKQKVKFTKRAEPYEVLQVVQRPSPQASDKYLRFDEDGRRLDPESDEDGVAIPIDIPGVGSGVAYVARDKSRNESSSSVVKTQVPAAGAMTLTTGDRSMSHPALTASRSPPNRQCSAPTAIEEPQNIYENLQAVQICQPTSTGQSGGMGIIIASLL